MTGLVSDRGCIVVVTISGSCDSMVLRPGRHGRATRPARAVWSTTTHAYVRCQHAATSRG